MRAALAKVGNGTSKMIALAAGAKKDPASDVETGSNGYWAKRLPL